MTDERNYDTIVCYGRCVKTIISNIKSVKYLKRCFSEEKLITYRFCLQILLFDM